MKKIFMFTILTSLLLFNLGFLFWGSIDDNEASTSFFATITPCYYNSGSNWGYCESQQFETQQYKTTLVPTYYIYSYW